MAADLERLRNTTSGTHGRAAQAQRPAASVSRVAQPAGLRADNLGVVSPTFNPAHHGGGKVRARLRPRHPAPAAQSRQTGSAPAAYRRWPQMYTPAIQRTGVQPGRAGQRHRPANRPTAPLTSVGHSVVRAPSENAWAVGPMGSGKTTAIGPAAEEPAPSPPAQRPAWHCCAAGRGHRFAAREGDKHVNEMTEFRSRFLDQVQRRALRTEGAGVCQQKQKVRRGKPLRT